MSTNSWAPYVRVPPSPTVVPRSPISVLLGSSLEFGSFPARTQEIHLHQTVLNCGAPRKYLCVVAHFMASSHLQMLSPSSPLTSALHHPFCPRGAQEAFTSSRCLSSYEHAPNPPRCLAAERLHPLLERGWSYSLPIHSSLSHPPLFHLSLLMSTLFPLLAPSHLLPCCYNPLNMLTGEACCLILPRSRELLKSRKVL